MEQENSKTKSIDEKLSNLPIKERINFKVILNNCLYDKAWCGYCGIKYSDPDVRKAKEFLYDELYVKNMIY